MIRRLAMLAVVSSALIGCGGPTSDSAQVRSVVQRYFAALASGNGSEVCSLLTGEAAQQMQHATAVVSAQLHRKKPLNCPEFVNLYSKALASEPTALAELKQTQVGTLSLAGDRATVRIFAPYELAKEVPLVKTTAGWRISRLRIRLLSPRKPEAG
jgi:hypothetical protein